MQSTHAIVSFTLQLVTTLHGCSVAICDKVKQSAEGAIQAVIEFVTRRGKELSEMDITRFYFVHLCWVFLFLFIS